MRARRLALTLLLTVAPTSPTGATVHHVPQDCTLQDCLNAASAGDTIAVAPNTYLLGNSLDLTEKSDLTLRGLAGPLHTILDGHATVLDGITINTAQDLRVTGFSVRNCTRYGIRVTSSSNIQLDNNLVYKNVSTGIDVPQTPSVSLNVTIHHNTVTKNKYGITIEAGCTGSIFNNVVWGNTDAELTCGQPGQSIRCNLVRLRPTCLPDCGTNLCLLTDPFLNSENDTFTLVEPQDDTCGPLGVETPLPVPAIRPWPSVCLLTLLTVAVAAVAMHQRPGSAPVNST